MKYSLKEILLLDDFYNFSFLKIKFFYINNNNLFKVEFIPKAIES